MLTEDVSDNFALGILDREHISDDDLTDLVIQFQNNEDIRVCRTCKKRKRLQVQVKHQTLFSKTIKLPLFCFHQLVKPLLSFAGQSRTSLFLVRRAWQQRQGVSWAFPLAKNRTKVYYTLVLFFLILTPLRQATLPSRTLPLVSCSSASSTSTWRWRTWQSSVRS